LGHRSVAQAQKYVSSAEFAEWIAFDNLEPIGEAEERADIRFGLLASMIANANRGRGERAFKPGDFMFRPELLKARPQTAEEMQARLRLALGRGKTERPGKGKLTMG
jgi:hypothetical protein